MLKLVVVATVAMVFGALIAVTGLYVAQRWIKRAVLRILWLLCIAGLIGSVIALALFAYGWTGAV